MQATSAKTFRSASAAGTDARFSGDRKPKLLPVVMTRDEVKAIHQKDLDEGWGRVQMPTALDRKYPNAPKDWRWQWVFPQQERWTGFEPIAEVLMPIRIRHYDKSLHAAQVPEARRVIAALLAESTASYADRKPELRILCGSI